MKSSKECEHSDDSVCSADKRIVSLSEILEVYDRLGLKLKSFYAPEDVGKVNPRVPKIDILGDIEYMKTIPGVLMSHYN